MRDIRTVARPIAALASVLAATALALPAPAVYARRTGVIINCPPPGVFAGGEGPGC